MHLDSFFESQHVRDNIIEESTFSRGLQLLRQIVGILEAEGEVNWIGSMRQLIADMERTPNEDTARQDTWKVVKGTYRTILGTRDGFADYIIWRDDFKARADANRELDALRTELWDILNA